MKTYSYCSTTGGKTNLSSRWKSYTLFVMLLLIAMSFKSMAQSDNRDREEQVVSVKVLFKKIQDNTGYRFFYNDEIEGLDQKVAIGIKRKQIDDILSELREKTSLQFKMLENNLIVVVPANSSQQEITVTGVIKSKDDQVLLPGVNIYVKGTTNGTISDINGKYELKVNNRYDVLVYSFIGFEQIEEPINARNTIDVELSQDMASIGEVVVTALNIERNKSSLGYSITQVGGDQINKAKENNPINSLAGKVSGLQITKAPTGVDGSSRVVLRGVSSLLGNNRPLFVIDGIPMSANSGGGGRWGGRDGGDELSDLNPEDIESMSVLKGAGASALYGSRGSNGVILIITKKGRKKKGIGVSFSSSYSIENPMVTPDFQSQYGQGAFGAYPPLNGPTGPNNDHPWIWSYGPQMDGRSVTDWHGEEESYTPQSNPYDEFFRTGTSFINTIAFDGGNEETTFRASITNQDTKGIMPKNNLSRQTLNLRGISKLGEKIKFDGKLTYIHSKVENRPHLSEDGANIVQSLNVLPRNISLSSLRNNKVDANGNELKWVADPTFSNPYWILDHVRNADEKHRLQSMFSITWDISSKFDFMVRSGFDFINSSGQSSEDPGRLISYQGLGSMSNSMNNSIEWNSDFLMSYDTKIGDLGINMSLGGNYRFSESKGLNQNGSRIKLPKINHISNYKSYSTDQWYNQREEYSLYGMTQLSFKNYLYLDITYRNDWSSALPLHNNSYGYHSENLSFLFTEAFGIDKSVLNSGKLRASYAKVGSDNGVGSYQIAQYYNVSQSDLQYPIGGIGSGLPFFDLAPEETHSYEVGTNLSFLNNRINLDLTYYFSMSDKQIMNVDLAPSTSYAFKKMNAGEVENRGIEVQIDASPLKSKNGINWDMILTWSANKSTVNKLYGDMNYLPLGSEFFMTMRAYPGRPYGEIYTRDYKRNSLGEKLVDNNGYPIVGDNKRVGDINPDWIAGLNNVVSYKDFSLSFLIDMQKGGDIYSWGNAYRALFGTSTETLEGRAEFAAGTGGYIESGINENTGQQNEVIIEPTSRWYHLYNKELGSEWVVDATNVRIREVSLSYSMPKSLLAKTPFSSVNLSLVGRNLFFIYKASKHFDPEAGYGSGNTSNGFEHMSLPSTRSYGVNLNVKF